MLIWLFLYNGHIMVASDPPDKAERKESVARRNYVAWVRQQDQERGQALGAGEKGGCMAACILH
jgi:hypothetical protein